MRGAGSEAKKASFIPSLSSDTFRGHFNCLSSLLTEAPNLYPPSPAHPRGTGPRFSWKSPSGWGRGPPPHFLLLKQGCQRDLLLWGGYTLWPEKSLNLLSAEGRGGASLHPPAPWKFPSPQTLKAVSAAPGLSHAEEN